jgi:hypothetical protein
VRVAWALLSASFLACTSCQTVNPTANQRSLVIARWGAIVRSFPIPAECERGETICFHVRNVIRFEDAERLGGASIPTTFDAAVWYHATPLPTTRVLMIVERDGQGWQAERLAYVRQGERMACFDKKNLKGLVPSVPVTKGQDKGSICVVV